MTTKVTQVPRWRKLTAGALGLVAACALRAAADEWPIVSIPLALLIVSAIVVHLVKLGPQLLARAVWWSSLASGVLLAVAGPQRDSDCGLVMAVACGAALLVIGRKGLAEASESAGYAPAAFRSSLLLLMVFALADAQTFLLFGIVSVK